MKTKMVFIAGVVLGASLLLPLVSIYLIRALIQAAAIGLILYLVLSMFNNGDQNDLPS